MTDESATTPARERARTTRQTRRARAPMALAGDSDLRDLAKLQRETMGYFLHETNPANGLVPDSTRRGAPSSIAAVGLALASYPVAVERGLMRRAEARSRVFTTLRFFAESPHGDSPNATGFRGFYYHFLDMRSGRRHRHVELSTMDTAILLAGVLTAAMYFNADSASERALRDIAAELLARADWLWARNGAATICHGWTPERGFLRHHWTGYNEALLLYVLALGSTNHRVPKASYGAWTSTYRWKKVLGQEFLYSGPLFTHQLPHVWLDFRGIQDAYMRARGIDYFENSRRATLVQQSYAARNPRNFRGYGPLMWGITASDGPGRTVRRVDGVERRFYDYFARGVPFGPDDGTLSPWGVVASLPFAPDVVLPTLRHFRLRHPEIRSRYGFLCSFNPTFPGGATRASGWVSRGYYGLEQGPVVLMIENFLSGFLWRLLRASPIVQDGLRRAGFTGAWLGA